MDNYPIQIANIIGTFLLAILAIFSQNIKRWFFRPELAINVGNEEPWIEIICHKFVDDTSAITDKVKISKNCELKMEVENIGNDIAKNFKVLIKYIYNSRVGGDSFYKVKVAPTEIVWTLEKESQDLLPKIPRYISIIRIEDNPELTASTPNKAVTEGTPNTLMSLLINVKGNYLKLEKGATVFVVMLYADNLKKIEEVYLRADWDGTKPEILPTPIISIRKMGDEEIRLFKKNKVTT